MKRINIISSTVVPLPVQNIDTDQIIPSRFLKSITKEGMGKGLFCDWRYDKNGKPNLDFVLNQDKYSGEILVVGNNFGCGSSREHAAWAIADYGFVAVVSSFFADIFKNNALNNQILPVQVSENFLSKIFKQSFDSPKNIVIINLPNQTITIEATKESELFEISPYKKKCLMEGVDDMTFLLNQKNKITQYEKNYNK